jgi:hypothetical protein
LVAIKRQISVEKIVAILAGFLYFCTTYDGKCFWKDWRKVLKFFAFFELIAQKGQIALNKSSWLCVY